MSSHRHPFSARFLTEGPQGVVLARHNTRTVNIR